MKKRLLALGLAIALILGLSLPAGAVSTEKAEESATLLYNLGLFRGTGTKAGGAPEFSLSRAPTRAEAVTILVRLLGEESAALEKDWTSPFSDVPAWAARYVGYAYNQGYAMGTSSTAFGAGTAVNAQQFLTFLLRSLGYADGTDFSYSAPWLLTDQLGITDGEYSASGGAFLRADAAVVSANALYALKKDGSKTLLKDLLDRDALSGSTVVVWDYDALLFQEDFASFLFYAVSGSPASFTSFKINKVTVNGLACQTLQVTTPEAVSAYLASIGYDAGGFGYVEITYDQDAAQAAATQTQTGSDGKTYPLLAFTFTYTATQADGTTQTGTFTDYYYLDE